MSIRENMSLAQSQPDRQAIAAQVQSILSHSSFRSSRRCSELLRYVAEKQLNEQTEEMKERMIGINLFGRSVDYDTSTDPVVRTTASDLRRRLWQYYHELGHENELRIMIPPGSYRVEFQMPGGDKRATFGAARPVMAVAAVSTTDGFSRIWNSRLKHWGGRAIFACLVLAAFVTIAWKRTTRPPQSLDEFWAPIAGSDPLISVGTWSLSSVTPEGSDKAGTPLDFHDLLPMTDAVAFSRVVAFLGQTRSAFDIKSAKATTLDDLTRSPVIFVGAVDNQWTMRVTGRLRFHFVQPSEGTMWVIEDRNKPDHKFVNGAGDMTDSTRDYALIARLVDKNSGQIAIVVAGMGAAGTTAASEFITTARYMDDLAKQVPKAFATENLEAIISVQVVDSKPGAPRLEAVETW